ncbi:MAG TPA: PLP-dependent transferase [Planctomycetota bacterium]|nr:PLP-dependent transferase [Planctomycetota bacterium]
MASAQGPSAPVPPALPFRLDLDTAAVRGGRSPDPASGAIVAPIHQTATFVQREVGGTPAHTYSRSSNPTVSALESALAALEDDGGGATRALAFRTGLAALSALFLGLCSAGDRVVVSRVVYGGTVRLLRRVLARFELRAEFVDTSDAQALAAALREPARLVLIETPANPTLVLTDVACAARLARGAGALLAVDNTFLTPAGQRCLDLGADLAVYSTTKLIEGHDATVGGAITTRDAALQAELAFARNALGSIQAPFDAWLTLRGLSTLPLRLRVQSAAALEVARRLAAHPRVARVAYPGLEQHPQHALARAQQLQHGALVAFEPAGGGAAARALVSALRLISPAENLGAVESLVTHPATMTHAALEPAEREALGIGDGLLRLSVGLESPAALIADLERGLAVAGGGA